LLGCIVVFGGNGALNSRLEPVVPVDIPFNVVFSGGAYSAVRCKISFGILFV
jgi:hypothetical protein